MRIREAQKHTDPKDPDPDPNTGRKDGGKKDLKGMWREEGGHEERFRETNRKQ